MKVIDKFLKMLKTDRNTFLTYVLTLITIYLVIDRIVEMLFMFLTGVAASYWGPITYTLALACPVFAFYFSGASKFVKNDATKISFFNIYCIALYIIGISMATQWLNYICWFLLTAVPNYSFIATTFSELVGPAIKSVTLYIPLVTIYPFFKWLFANINDTKDIKDSILDYGGINLTVNKEGTGPYTCEVPLCKDGSSGKIIKVPEVRRYEVSLIVGVSGSGKTTMVFEPMMANDIEKKAFFRSVSKELGYNALKNGLATLNCPYDNDYINKNFSLNMLTPNSAKEKVYNAYMKNVIQDYSGGKYTYRTLGLTSLSPDYESIKHIKDVADNYNIPVNIIDPNDPSSIGLNPFTHDDPTKTAIVISSVLRGMYKSIDIDTDEVYKENVAMQAVENLSILLKEMYPRLHDGLLPNLEDMLKMLNNFDLVQEMCEKLETDSELAEQYAIQIGYFKKNFYKGATGREETEKNVYVALTQLDTLLRYPGVKNILCNRNHNINFDEALANGDITLVCTRRGDLGATAHKAFGLFFILLMQYSVLSRPGNEKNRTPHFLYIDEFASFVCEATTPIFTLYRKYRVGSIISSQNLSQFNTEDGNENYKKIILANSTTKLVFGNNTPEDNQWWQTEFGTKREWKFKRDYNLDKVEYESKAGGIEWGWTDIVKAGKLQTLKFKACAYKTKDVKGSSIIGTGKVDFLASKYKEPKIEKTFKFNRFTKGIVQEKTETEKAAEEKFDPSKISFDDYISSGEEVDPIQTDSTDSKYFFDNEDAISFNLKKKKNEE